MIKGISPQSIPLGRPLKRHELEAYIAAIVQQEGGDSSGNGFGPGGLQSVAELGNKLGLQGAMLDQFSRSNSSIPYALWYDEFINTLVLLEIIIRKWHEPSGNYYKVSERGKELPGDVSKLNDETTRIFLEGLRDEELRSRCKDSFLRAKHMDTLVRDACVVLEDRIRNKVGAGAAEIGVNLVSKALRSKDGDLVVSDIVAEQEGAHHLFWGAIKFFGNPTHHRLLADLPAVRVRETIGFIDILLQILSEAKPRR